MVTRSRANRERRGTAGRIVEAITESADDLDKVDHTDSNEDLASIAEDDLKLLLQAQVKLQALITKARRKRNLCVPPIGKPPVEILFSIFHLFLQQTTSSWATYHERLLTLFHVSHQWREIVNDYPYFWTVMSSTYGPSLHEIVASKSSGLPVDVFFGDDPSTRKKIERGLYTDKHWIDAWSRCKRADLTVIPSSWDGLSIISFLGLEELRLRFVTAEDEGYNEVDLELIAPKLRQLFITSSRTILILNVENFHALTTLTIKLVETLWVNDVVGILRRCPGLQYLEFDAVKTAEMDSMLESNDWESAIHLRQLHTLIIKETHWDLTKILLRLIMAPQCRWFDLVLWDVYPSKYVATLEHTKKFGPWIPEARSPTVRLEMYGDGAFTASISDEANPHESSFNVDISPTSPIPDFQTSFRWIQSMIPTAPTTPRVGVHYVDHADPATEQDLEALPSVTSIRAFGNAIEPLVRYLAQAPRERDVGTSCYPKLGTIRLQYGTVATDDLLKLARTRKALSEESSSGQSPCATLKVLQIPETSRDVQLFLQAFLGSETEVVV